MKKIVFIADQLYMEADANIALTIIINMDTELINAFIVVQYWTVRVANLRPITGMRNR